MSVLENPELEEKIKGSMVAQELYLRGAFDEETSVELENYSKKVAGVLFLEDNGLVGRVQGGLYSDGVLGRPVAKKLTEASKDDIPLGDEISFFYLTEKGKKLVECQVTLVDAILNGSKGGNHEEETHS